MLTLFRKEVSSFLNSLIGYIVIIVFLLFNGLFLWVFPLQFNILETGFSNIDGLFILAPFVFLFLIPAITMRSFAEEKKTGTIEVLFTQPLSDLEIIIAKYFAGIVLLIISLLPTLFYVLSIDILGLPPGNFDSGGIWGSYIGLLFLGAAFISIGLFASSISDNQIVSFVIAVLLCGFIYIGFELINTFALSGTLGLLVQQLGINEHYSSVSRGVLDTRDIVYFVSLIAIFILSTKLSLESRKW